MGKYVYGVEGINVMTGKEECGLQMPVFLLDRKHRDRGRGKIRVKNRRGDLI